LSRSIYYAQHLGERAARNANLQLRSHRAFMATQNYTGPDGNARRAADKAELARLEERIAYGSNHNHW